jgi:hypothetical protein
VRREVSAWEWEEERNRQEAKVEWRFTTEKVREKFHRFHPKAQ